MTIPNDILFKIRELTRRANETKDAISREIILNELDQLLADKLHVLEGDAAKIMDLFARAIRTLACAL